jgi:hypothetical protein
MTKKLKHFTLVVVWSASVKFESSKSGSISGKLVAKVNQISRLGIRLQYLPDTFQFCKAGRLIVFVPPTCPVKDPRVVFLIATGTLFHRILETDFGAITSIAVVPFKSPVWYGN